MRQRTVDRAALSSHDYLVLRVLVGLDQQLQILALSRNALNVQLDATFDLDLVELNHDIVDDLPADLILSVR